MLLKFTGEIKIRSYETLWARTDFEQAQFDVAFYKILILDIIDSQEMVLRRLIRIFFIKKSIFLLF